MPDSDYNPEEEEGKKESPSLGDAVNNAQNLKQGFDAAKGLGSKLGGQAAESVGAGGAEAGAGLGTASGAGAVGGSATGAGAAGTAAGTGAGVAAGAGAGAAGGANPEALDWLARGLRPQHSGCKFISTFQAIARWQSALRA